MKETNTLTLAGLDREIGLKLVEIAREMWNIPGVALDSYRYPSQAVAVTAYVLDHWDHHHASMLRGLIDFKINLGLENLEVLRTKELLEPHFDIKIVGKLPRERHGESTTVADFAEEYFQQGHIEITPKDPELLSLLNQRSGLKQESA